MHHHRNVFTPESTMRFENINAISSGDDDFVDVVYAECFVNNLIYSTLFLTGIDMCFGTSCSSKVFGTSRHQSNFIPIAEEDW